VKNVRIVFMLPPFPAAAAGAAAPGPQRRAARQNDIGAIGSWLLSFAEREPYLGLAGVLLFFLIVFEFGFLAVELLPLSAPGGFRMPLFGEPAGLTSVPQPPRTFLTTYVDTPDLRLARWGCSIRHRSGEGWTVRLSSDGRGALLVRSQHVFDPGGDLLPDVREQFEWVEGRALFLHDVQVPQPLRRRGYGSLLAADAILTLARHGTAVFAHPGPTDIESVDAEDVRRLRSETENTRFLAALGFRVGDVSQTPMNRNVLPGEPVGRRATFTF
jgi:GNAT superfamily N-acetyltransferase